MTSFNVVSEIVVDPAAETWLGADPGDALLRIEVVERAGHALWIDQPTAVRKALRHALGSAVRDEKR